MPLVLGCCVDRPIERTEDGRFVVHAGGRRIEAEHVDVAVGPGPAKRLRDAYGRATVVSEEDERTLLADGRMVFGQDHWQQPARSGRVLVIGGGATAAWNVERALRHGAVVTWVAPATPWKRSGPKELKAEQIARHLDDHPDLHPERRRWLERVQARLVAFRGADLPRNRAVFRESGVEWWWGTVKHLRPCHDRVAAICWTKGRDDPQELEFDQVIVSIGQDGDAPEASAQLVGRLPMTWLEHDHEGTRPANPGSRPTGRIVGACEVGVPSRLRCLGVLLRQPAWTAKLGGLSKRRRSNAIPGLLETRLEKQANAAPRYSMGIDGAVFHVSANVVLANGLALDPSLGHERHELVTSTWVRGYVK
jgi:Putative NAD(P)-binding